MNRYRKDKICQAFDLSLPGLPVSIPFEQVSGEVTPYFLFKIC